MLHWSEHLTKARNSIIALIKIYRVKKDPIVLRNLKRMLQLRRDIIDYEEFKKGKGIVRMNEPYDSCPPFHK